MCRSAIEDAHATSSGTPCDATFEGDLAGRFDSVCLHQLFANLLVNAAKYRVAGEPVRLRVVGSADAVRVDVNNRGPAIPPSAWQSIFQPLVQLSSDAATDPKDPRTSLGLGLYIAREIATLQGFGGGPAHGGGRNDVRCVPAPKPGGNGLKRAVDNTVGRYRR